MVRRPHILWVICVSVLALAAARADEPAEKQDRAIDPAKLPPGAVIVISDNPRDALRHVDAIVLSPAEYKKLLEAAEQGRRAQDLAESPSTCRIAGKIEQRGGRGVAVLSATMKFRTTAPHSVVAIGLSRCKATAATVDGRLAVFGATREDGSLAVTVNAPGEHTLQIEFETPLIVRPGEVSFEVGLPGAAITALERLDLPPHASGLRVGGRPVPKSDLAGGMAVLLGPAKTVEVKWREKQPGTAEPRLTVEAKTDVNFADVVVSRTRLTVKWPAGSVVRFEVSAPADARFEPDPADPAVVVEKPSTPGLPRWTVRPPDHLSECVLEVEVRTPFEFGSAVAVGPVRVEGAVRQRGAITIGSSNGVRLVLDPVSGANVVRRDTPESLANETTFTYLALPPSGDLVRVTPQKLHGQIDTQFQHQLSLTERGCRWQGKLELRPVRTEAAFVDIEAPAELDDFRSASPDTIEAVTVSGPAPGGRRLLRVRFVEPIRRPTTIAFDGTYSLPDTAREAVIPLPRVLNTVDRGGQVTVSPPPGIEVCGAVREWTGDKVAEISRALEPVAKKSGTIAAATDRSPAHLALSWRSADRDMPVTATAYVQLGERQASVRHRFHLPTTAAATTLRLTGPASLAGRIRGGSGTTLQPAAPGEWLVQPPAPSAGETVVTIHYSFPLSVNPLQKTEEVPLVWLDQFTDIETDVVIWSGAGPNGHRRPVQAIGPWTEVAPTIVADMPAVPSMSLHGSGAELPLAINLDDSAGAAPPVHVERMWVQALIEQDGRKIVRIRSVVRPQGTQWISLSLPRAVAQSQFQSMLDGKRLPVNPGDGGGSAVRLRIDADPARANRLLEMIYVLLPDHASKRFLTHIETPEWERTAQLPVARWQIGFSDEQAAVAFGPIDGAEHWTWDRGLLELQPRWNSTALSKWLIGDTRYSDLEAAGLGSSFTALGAIGEPVWVLHAPRSAAWLVGSVGILVFGLAWLAADRRARALLAILVVAVIGALMMINPPLISAAIVFVQPGIAILALVLVGRAILSRWERPGVFQSVGTWTGRATVPLTSPRQGRTESHPEDAEPNVIPLKRG